MDLPFNIDEQATPKRGDLLISEPFQTDAFFGRSVIYICSHNKKGTFGLVLNIPISESIADIVPNVAENNCSIGIGGPVSTDELFYLHRNLSIKGQEKVGQNLYLGGNQTELNELIKSGKATEKNLRFFVGYSGWGSNQLEEELKEKTWIVYTPDANFDPLLPYDNALWKGLMKQKGGKYSVMAEFPENPSYN